MRYSLVAVVVAGSAASCAPRPVAPESPRFVSVTLVGATVAPAKFDGTQWDGTESISSQVMSSLRTALDLSDPASAAARVLTGPAMRGIEKPEPKGTATLIANGVPDQRMRLAAQRDTFTPIWRGPPTWRHVPLSHDVRLRVELFDDDFAFDDPIGTFELGQDDFMAALRSGHVHQVRVDEQTNRQVLFAGISVTAE